MGRTIRRPLAKTGDRSSLDCPLNSARRECVHYRVGTAIERLLLLLVFMPDIMSLQNLHRVCKGSTSAVMWYNPSAYVKSLLESLVFEDDLQEDRMPPLRSYIMVL